MRPLLLCGSLFASCLWAQDPVPTPIPAAPPAAVAPVRAPVLLNHGHLDPAWYDLPASAFGPHKWADFGWEKPGFKLGGRSIKVAWEDPRWTDSHMEADNLAAAEAHRKSFPQHLKDSLGAVDGVKISLETGDLLLVGRLVDCNIKGSFLSMAMEDITWDLKMVDPVTGETLVALHNRLMGGPGWKGNGSRKRFLSWTESLAGYLKDHWLP